MKKIVFFFAFLIVSLNVLSENTVQATYGDLLRTDFTNFAGKWSAVSYDFDAIPDGYAPLGNLNNAFVIINPTSGDLLRTDFTNFAGKWSAVSYDFDPIPDGYIPLGNLNNAFFIINPTNGDLLRTDFTNFAGKWSAVSYDFDAIPDGYAPLGNLNNAFFIINPTSGDLLRTDFTNFAGKWSAVSYDFDPIPDGYAPLGNLNNAFVIISMQKPNTPPTPPTLIVPSTDFVSGSQQTISWNSTDADGDTLTYTLEASYNNGTSWTTLYSGANKTYTYTVPTNQTQVSFRVRAYDGTAYSSYSTSVNITIKEILYNWSKYNNKIETSQTINWEGVPTEQSSLSTGGMYYYSINDLYSSVSVQGGKIVGSGTKIHTYGQEFTRSSGTFYNVYPNGDLTYRIIILGNDGMWLRYSTQMGRLGSSTSTNVRGTLVTNNIQAGYNAYVHNQRNSDGYWYVRGGLAESTPETPTLTVPTVQFEHGDIHLITWNSSNADSVTYTFEASYNNGTSWSSLYNGTNKNYTYTVPSNQTQVLFRVKASNGYNDSAYATSINKTIREVMYSWSKYNALNNGYTVGSTSVSYRTYTINSNYSLQGRLAQPFLDYMPDTGRPYYNQIGSVINLELYDVGRTIYGLSTSSSETTYTKSTIISYDGATGYAGIYEEFYQTPILIAYKPGTLIQGDVQAGYNAYTHNARNPDGYWWVRGQRVLAGDISPPIIELTEQTEMGRASTVTVNTFDVSSVTVTKWAVGNQPISYFASGGINVTNNKFIALSNGVYTVYAKDAKGNEGVKTIAVTKVDPFTVYTYDDASALISTSIGHSLLISSDQHVYAFGSNDVGQLGLGDTTDRHMPTKIESINNAVAVSAGQQSLVLTEDGDVYAFGYNASGQLGLGDSNNRNVPVKIPGISNAIAIDASEMHSMILTEDGSVYTFGDNSFGQLGIIGVSERNVPTKVTGISNAVGISAGVYHSLVLTEDGAVYGFGFNYNGQLGLGNTTQQDTATKIPGISNAISVSAGDMHSLVLTENGEVYGFGSNVAGELGLGDTMDRFTPTKITSLHDVVSISASSEFSLFVTKNGEAYSTDLNGKDPIEPNLGKIPVKIATIENAVAISGGYAQLFIITEDQNVYSFGSNSYGQLGHGNTTNRLVPTKITAVQSAVIDLDRINPTGNLTANTTNWFTSDVLISANGWDSGGSGFYKIKTPDGQVVLGSSTAFAVSSNGTYTFSFYDRAKNRMEQSITIANIDKGKPVITFTPEELEANFSDLNIQVAITDVGASGFKQARFAWSKERTKPSEGWSEWSSNSHPSIEQNTAGKWYLHIEAEDYAGNVAYATSGVYEKITISGGPSVNINVFPVPTGTWVNQPINVYVMDSGDTELLAKATKQYEVTNSPLYPNAFNKAIPSDKKTQLNLQGENFIHIQYTLEDGTKISATSGPYLIDTGTVGDFELKLINTAGVEVKNWTNQNLRLVIGNPTTSSVSGFEKQYRIEGLHQDWQTYQEGMTITTEGNHRIFGRIVSGTGTSSVQKTAVAKIDQTKPAISSLRLIKTTNNQYDVFVKADDPFSGVKEVKLNSGTLLEEATNGFELRGLTAKPTSVTIQDLAGNSLSAVSFAAEPTITFDAPYTLTTPLHRSDAVAKLSNATGYLLGNRGYSCSADPCGVTIEHNTILTAVRSEGTKETRTSVTIQNIDQSELRLVLAGKRSSVAPKELTFSWNYALTSGTLTCTEDGQTKVYAVSGKQLNFNGSNYTYNCSLSGTYKGVSLHSNSVSVFPDGSIPVDGTGGVAGSRVTTNVYHQKTMLGKGYLINGKSHNYKQNALPIPQNEITAN